MRARRVVTVFGGAGFLGRRIVRRLANKGCEVRVALRYPQQALSLTPSGNVGQIVPLPVDITDQDAVNAALDGADAAINAVGTFYEKGARRTFRGAHVEGAARVALAVRNLKIPKLVHVSALGASERAGSAFLRSKAEGEELVQRAFPEATILRPALMFGPGDRFFERLASFARLTGVLPFVDKDAAFLKMDGRFPRFGLTSKGGSHLQPIYVENVAEAAVRALESDGRDNGYRGTIYELGGPARYSMKELMDLIMRASFREYRLMPVPVFWAKVHAAYLQLFPNPWLTIDQVDMLQADTVLTGTKPDITAFGVPPTPAEAVLPTYLERHRDADQRQMARAFR